MRQETNNEIDLLLCRMSRQDAGSVGEASDYHLDADELSSYAQNALPPAARARYTEHIAECSTCRKLVAELSLALGTTAAAAAPAQSIVAPSALKNFLASLFSPMVLRYAVPALGLIIVAAIGFAIFREPRNNTFVAQRGNSQAESKPFITPESPAPGATPPAIVDGRLQKDSPAQAANPKEPVTKSEAASGAAAGSGPAPAGTPAARDEVAAAAPPPAVAAEPQPAKTAAVAESEAQKKEEEKKKDDAIAKKEPSPRDSFQTADTAKANEQTRDYSAPKPAANRVDESKREILPLQRRSVGGGVANVSRSRTQTGAQTEGQADKDNAETRTVSGRRFRKERGIWTDTAYDSSTPTVNMARGSEQFRALVADEPEIKKIAEQLDGEVIVVWKGRAYRIR
jgi:hypothetical protein